MVHAMLYTVLALEVSAFSRGAVSFEFPREVYAKLSWPTWGSSIPNDWSLFMPLNSRYIPIHDRAPVTGDLIADVDEESDGSSSNVSA